MAQAKPGGQGTQGRLWRVLRETLIGCFAPLLTVAVAQAEDVRPPPKPLKQIHIIGDGDRYPYRMLRTDPRSGAVVMRSGERVPVESQLPDYEVTGFHASDAFLLRFGRSRSHNLSQVDFLEPSKSLVFRLTLPDFRLDSAVYHDDFLYVADGERPLVRVDDLCAYEFAPVLAIFCADRKRGMRSSWLETGMPPIADLVAFSGLREHFLVSAHRFESVLAALDVEYGKIIDALDLDAPPIGVVLEGMSIGGQADTRRSAVLVALPAARRVDLFDVDTDFRQLRLATRIELEDLARVPAPVVAETAGDVAFWSRASLVGKIAGSDDQSLLLIGGEGNTIHGFARDHDSRGGVRRLFDLRGGAGEIVDFDLSSDGRRLAVLFADGPMMIDTRDLISGDPGAALALLGAEEVKGESDAERDLTTAIQRRLRADGFYSGTADGYLGRETVAALERFLAANGTGIPVDLESNGATELPLDVLAKMFWNDLDSFPPEVLDARKRIELYQLSFDLFFAAHMPGVRNFAPSEIYGTDPSCVPAPALWPGIVRPLRALQELRDGLGEAINVTVRYQPPSVRDCHGSEAGDPEIETALEAFRGIGFQVPKVAPARVRDALSTLATHGRLLHTATDSNTYFLAAPQTPQNFPQPIGPAQIQIASHELTTRGCGEAVEDVAEFARHLAGTELAGRRIYISRAGEANTQGAPEGYHVVAIDLGEDIDLGRRWIRLVRDVAPKTDDGKTGADAFARFDPRYTMDLGCLSGQIIP